MSNWDYFVSVWAILGLCQFLWSCVKIADWVCELLAEGTKPFTEEQKKAQREFHI